MININVTTVWLIYRKQVSTSMNKIYNGYENILQGQPYKNKTVEIWNVPLYT